MPPNHFMQRAIEIAQRGAGAVEPNPLVGCVLVKDGTIVAEGWHEKFGGPHAEVNAIRKAESQGIDLQDVHLYVTLEPCCHHGKTPPCCQAILAAGIKHVVIGSVDPAEHVSGRGIRELQDAGVEVSVGLLADQTNELIAPFRRLQTDGRPWVHLKWGMSLDGKTSGNTGQSKWITCEESRAIVHELRGRMDAILVGANTVHADDPLLTVRPPGPRTPVRIVFDRSASTPADSRLLQTVNAGPVLICCSENSDAQRRQSLAAAGAELFCLPPEIPADQQIQYVLDELGNRKMTNVLVEGGGTLAGSFLDAGRVDEVHAFIAPLVIGGTDSAIPLGGIGFPSPAEALRLASPEIRTTTAGNVYVHGRIN